VTRIKAGAGFGAFMTVKSSSHSQSLNPSYVTYTTVHTVELNNQESKSAGYEAITFIQSRTASYFTAQRPTTAALTFMIIIKIITIITTTTTTTTIQCIYNYKS
jgi:hypothetical protein